MWETSRRGEPGLIQILFGSLRIRGSGAILGGETGER